MSSTTATASAPKPVEATAKPAQAGAREPKDKAPAADIFSSLLNLLASTQVLPEATVPTGDSAPDDRKKADGEDNPLTALMGWGLPGGADGLPGNQAGKNAATGELGLPGAAWSADRAGAGTQGGELDISDMTAVESTPLELAPKGAVAAPAFAPRPGAAPVPWVRSADATGSVAAPQWRHASMASTETLAIQQASNASAVRSTVALNDRFGATPGVPLGSSELREVAADGFGLPSAAGATSRAPDAASALPASAGGEGAAGSDHSGSDARSFDKADAPADKAFADANANAAEEPTVTHWGTQHLRHASLRVGGEADEQAIDIQLSMKGQEVQVEFKTDSAEARASLREHAGESLGDLLGRSGMQLGGVSVGAHNQQGSRGDGASARQNGVRALASAQEAVQPSASAAKPATRADGSQPLDVFA